MQSVTKKNPVYVGVHGKYIMFQTAIEEGRVSIVPLRNLIHGNQVANHTIRYYPICRRDNAIT